MATRGQDLAPIPDRVRQSRPHPAPHAKGPSSFGGKMHNGFTPARNMRIEAGCIQKDDAAQSTKLWAPLIRALCSERCVLRRSMMASCRQLGSRFQRPRMRNARSEMQEVEGVVMAQAFCGFQKRRRPEMGHEYLSASSNAG
jgi:hypothetical protein